MKTVPTQKVPTAEQYIQTQWNYYNSHTTSSFYTIILSKKISLTINHTRIFEQKSIRFSLLKWEDESFRKSLFGTRRYSIHRGGGGKRPGTLFSAANSPESAAVFVYSEKSPCPCYRTSVAPSQDVRVCRFVPSEARAYDNVTVARGRPARLVCT